MAAASLAWYAPGALAADDPLLKRLIGEWEGIGQFRWDSTSEPERAYCKISNTIAADGTFREIGRCALATNSASLSMELKAGGPGVYSGSATGSTGLGIVARRTAPIAGTGKGNQIVLTAPPAEGEAGPAITIIDLQARGFRVRTERVDPATGKKYTAGDVTFGPSQG
jgi:hypothetical protein